MWADTQGGCGDLSAASRELRRPRGVWFSSPQPCKDGPFRGAEAQTWEREYTCSQARKAWLPSQPTSTCRCLINVLEIPTVLGKGPHCHPAPGLTNFPSGFAVPKVPPWCLVDLWGWPHRLKVICSRLSWSWLQCCPYRQECAEESGTWLLS